MNCRRYLWLTIIFPSAMSLSTFHRTSAPYPWSIGMPHVSPAGQSEFRLHGIPVVTLQRFGTGSPPSRFQSFFAGSPSGVTVIAGGFWDESTVRTAAFHVPKTAWGGIGVPPDCQSPALLFASLVMSVMKSEGNIGRSHLSGKPEHDDVSVPAWSPFK